MLRPFVRNPEFLKDWKEGTQTKSDCRTCNNCYWKKASTCLIRD
jgi:2,4-dienoyl-CoA reductase-like NADH-dependent reductase (Old Yellow Enzyme family)